MEDDQGETLHTVHLVTHRQEIQLHHEVDLGGG